jgi:hypothetical protein
VCCYAKAQEFIPGISVAFSNSNPANINEQVNKFIRTEMRRIVRVFYQIT